MSWMEPNSEFSAASGFVHTNGCVRYYVLNHGVHTSLDHVPGCVKYVMHLSKEKLNLIKIEPSIQCHLDIRLC